MKLKKLQSNYTTPEQAKRLIELGMPKNSADCYYELGHERSFIWNRNVGSELSEDFFDKTYRGGLPICIPCWSAGRLIEIFCLMTGRESCRIAYKRNMIDSLIFAIEDNISMGFENLYEDEQQEES